jgi:hypothetical protein
MFVGIGLLATPSALAQSVSLGNGTLDVFDGTGDTVFNVGSGGDVNIGGTGTDTDLYARESTGNISLYFNTSLAQLYIGGPDDLGNIFTRDTTNTVTTQINGFGDLFLGGGAQDGDITVKDTDGSTTTMLFDGALGDLTLGANGVAGDDGDLYLRDVDGLTNNIIMPGSTADVRFGSTVSGDDGDLSLSDGSADNFAIDLEGSSGTIYNKLSGNGLVKGWARINADGTVASCWNCTTSTSETQNLGTGAYEVDFPFIGADISSRPVLCAAGHTGVFGAAAFQIYCVQRSLDPSSIYLQTRNATGTLVDSPFTVVVY